VGKEEFVKEAIKLGYSQELIDDIIKDNEADMALGIPVDWKRSLVVLPISD